jgi:pimeloyl-ACP methyl ester carboxylesterase
VDLDGPVHYVDYGGPNGGPLLVYMHGLGGSLVNWAAVASALARANRVLALDLASPLRNPNSAALACPLARTAVTSRSIASTSP